MSNGIHAAAGIQTDPGRSAQRMHSAQDVAIVMAAICAGWLVTKYLLYPALGAIR